MKINCGVAFPFLGSLAVSGILICNIDQTVAQITPDHTLGKEKSVVNNVNFNRERIDGGARRGGNLFHSFSEFNVGENRGVYFTNPNGVNNIFSRVTGENISNIFGTLGVNGTANLFLINPNGIVFGENAALDVQGSFTATTAAGIEFGERGDFSADTPESPGLLTVNPSAYLFNQVPKGSIVNNSRANNNLGLQLQPDKNISLIAGNVSLNGGKITAPAGNVQFGGLSTAGEIGINTDGSLSFPEGVARSDVSLTRQAFVDVSGTEGGNITVNANNLEILGKSELQTGTFASTGLSGGQSGDIILNATGAVKIDESTLDSSVEIGNAGNIEISTANFSLTNGAEITSSTFGEGNAGNVSINVGNNVSLNTGGVFSNVGSKAEGNAGAITISANSISLNNGAQIQSGVFKGGLGNSNNVTLNARGNVKIASDNGKASGIFTDVETNSIYDAGNIKINAQGSIILDDASLNSKNSGDGVAGDITLKADEKIVLNNSSIFTESNDNNLNTKIFSSIDIEASNGSIFLDRSTISTDNLGTGYAGDITLNARDRIDLNQSTVSSNGRIGRILIGKSDISKVTSSPKVVNLNNSTLSTSNDSSSGEDLVIDAGEISIDAINKISFLNQSIIGASTKRKGNAGDITISSKNGNVLFDNSNIFSNVEVQGIGNAGNIDITASFITLKNGAQLQSGIVDDNSQGGQGNGGNITLNATKDVKIIGRNQDGKYSAIYSDVEQNATGNAGNIFINAQGSIILNSLPLDPSNSNRVGLNSTNASDGLAGDITLKADEKIVLNNSSIFTESNDNNLDPKIFSLIDIKASKGSIFLDRSNISTDNLGTGYAGDITLNARDRIDLNQSTVSSNGRIGRILIGKSDISKVTSSPKVVNLNNSTLSTSNDSSSGEDLVIDAGEISIDAVKKISLNRSEIDAFTERKGNAGSVTLRVNNGDLFFADGSSIFNTVESGTDTQGNPTITQGNAGNINIIAKNLTMIDGAQLQTLVRFGQDGDAGDINITASGNVSLSGFTNIDFAGNKRPFPSSIFSSNNGQGNAGNINIQSNSLTLDGSNIDTTNFPSSRFVFVSGEPIKSGNVTVTLKDKLVMRNDSDISTQANENVNGGNINITADAIIAFDDSDIFAFAQDERGGNIILNTPAYLASSFNVNYSKIKPNSANRFFENNDRADLNATGAVSGTIQIPDVSFIQNSLANIYQNFIRTEDIIANSCVSPSQRKEGKFMITGAGGLPQSPLDDEQTSTFPTGEVRNLSDRSWQKGDPIEEPTGVYELENGELVMSRECFSK